MLTKLHEFREYLDIGVLLAAIFSGIVGDVGLAVACIAAYLLSDTVAKTSPAK